MKKVSVPFKVLSIEEDGFHPHIEVRINNKTAVLLIDTGASKTVFDINLINNFVENLETLQHDKFTTGLGTNNMVSHKAIISKFCIGALEVLELDAVLLDLSHVNLSYDQLEIPQIVGVLGSDLLEKYKAVIDFNTKKISFSFNEHD